MEFRDISEMDVQRYSSSGQTFGHLPNYYPVLNSSPFLAGGGDGVRRQSGKCQVGGYLSDWRQSPRVVSFRSFVRGKISEVFLHSSDYAWGELASEFASVLENQLFMQATSEEEYVNENSLYHRVQSLLQNKPYNANSSEQLSMPSCVPMPTSGLPNSYCCSGAAEAPFNCLNGASRSDSTDNYAFRANNADHVNLMKGSPLNGYKQGDANRFITSNELDMSFSSGLGQVSSEIVLPLEDASASITPYSNANQFSVIGDLDNGAFFPQGNMSYSSDLTSDYLVQLQHLDHGLLGSYQNTQSMDSPSTVGEFSVFSSSNLLIPQHVPMEVPELSNILPGTIFAKEISTLEDIVQSCSQVIESQHNQKRPLHAYSWHQVPPEQSHGAEQYASDGPSSENIEDMLPSSKRLKMESKNENSHLFAASVARPCAPEGLSYLHRQSESPVSINSEVTHVEMEPVKNSLQDPMRIGDSDVISKMNSESVLIPSGGQTVFCEMDQIDHTSSSEIIDNVKEVPEGMGSKSIHFVSDEHSGDFIKGEARTERIQTEPIPDSDPKEVIESQNPVTKGVCLTEYLTEEQIKEHLLSLGQSIDQSTLMEERESSEKVCHLCALGKLFFAPAPIYCSCCSARIKRSVNYYCTPDEHGVRYCFCTLCHNQSRGGNISFLGIRISKATLSKKKNDEEIEESWVQCDNCQAWQHQICALFSDKHSAEGKAEYICLKCLLKETECGGLKNLTKNAVFSAKDLPTTMLSDHIEERIFLLLKQEREERAKVKGIESSEVPGAEDLVVRVVLSVQKTLKVKQKFLDLFHDENYPAEFPYRSKVILLFQKIEGVDVCLFGMYVQEFGSECSHPNKRCVYVSYLDSIKYFRPETKTVSGEALRTFVYHEILIAYLEFCKKRGFVTAYIWACPPLKGEDYILYCHPEIQKTPKPDKLRQWYQSMIKKAANEKIVVSFTNLYDRFFLPTGECNSKVTAARLPYFDGDYWSGAAEDVIRKIEEERTADSQKKGKKTITKRTLKAMGHTNPSDGSTKDILLMQKLGQTILPIKEDFIIVDMQYVCTHCHEAIISGERWSCSQCKNFHLCERCHDADRKTYGWDMHISINMEQHALSQVMVDDVLSDTKDEDLISSNRLLENRHTFLSLCEKNHYQFDTLRRAKYSSIMILHHLQNATALTAGNTCSVCYKDAVVDQRWLCEICPEFGVCATCYQEKGSSCHIHRLTQSSPTVNHSTESRKARKRFLKAVVDVLHHAQKCRSSTCSYPNCPEMRRLICHAKQCPARATGRCRMCSKLSYAMKFHLINCREPNCGIPRSHGSEEVCKRAAVAELVR